MRGFKWLIGPVLLAGCGLTQAPAGSGGMVVVAAENFWGSIAAQVGGERVRVTSLVVNPATDPHAYEATPADARLMAQARVVVLNGAGYDAWANKLLSANPVGGRQVVDIGALVGKKEGDNAHFWYSPSYVDLAIDRLRDSFKQIDPAGASYFDGQAAAYRAEGLREYRELVASIKQRFAGTAVGATESVFGYLAEALGLKLTSPPGYMQAVAEGTEVSVSDKSAFEQQVALGQLKVLVFNSQNTTPDVNAIVSRARAKGIPVVAVTETLSPPSSTFQVWQVRQLRALLAALAG